jgi:hypothetical protein
MAGDEVSTAISSSWTAAPGFLLGLSKGISVSKADGEQRSTDTHCWARVAFFGEPLSCPPIASSLERTEEELPAFGEGIPRERRSSALYSFCHDKM